jgi:hypothetical protein
MKLRAKKEERYGNISNIDFPLSRKVDGRRRTTDDGKIGILKSSATTGGLKRYCNTRYRSIITLGIKFPHLHTHKDTCQTKNINYVIAL